MSGAILDETYTLAGGVGIPKLGLGTWLIDNAAVAQVVRDAAAVGYRHFDTAQAYGNEEGVSEGLRASGVARDELFVTSKVAAECKDYDGAAAGIARSLTALGLDRIDMMLIHSPQPWSDFRKGERCFDSNLEVWRALEDAFKAGKLRAIGVSNFERADLDNILANGAIVPAMNQVLAHVGNTPFELIDYTTAQGILVEADSPVGHGAVLKNAELAAMAERYAVSIPQLCIRYCLELGLLPLPKTMTPAHMRENAAVDFALSEADVATLRTVEIREYGEAGRFPVFGGSEQIMPHVTVKRYAGRSPEQKAALADAITRAVTNTLGDGSASGSVAIEDVASADWMDAVYRPEIAGAGDRLFKRPGYGPLAQQGDR